MDFLGSKGGSTVDADQQILVLGREEGSGRDAVLAREAAPIREGR
jgi:hypothetical protein